jgi:hypothetical protein
MDEVMGKPMSTAEERYVEAVHDLVNLICAGDSQLKRMESELISEYAFNRSLSSELTDKIFHRKGQLILEYVSKVRQ